MPHELTEIDGQHAFVYNQQRGNPWHALGNPVQGDMTAAGALRFARCNDNVTLQPVWTAFDGDDAEIVPGVMATVSDIYGPMAVVGQNWQPTQCEELVDLAYQIAGLAGEDAHVDTMGRLGPQGQRFFTYIRFQEFVLDPQGIADTIDRGLFVGTAFDGSMANTIGLTSVRVVCANTMRFAMEHLKDAVKVKHTTNVEERMHEAAAAIGYAGAVQRQTEAKAQALLRVDNPPLGRVLERLWPTEGLDDDHPHLGRREAIHDRIWDLYLGESYAEGMGKNGWSAYNAITEWLDHERPVRAKGAEATARRFQQTLLDVEHNVNARKARAAELLLAGT